MVHTMNPEAKYVRRLLHQAGQGVARWNALLCGIMPEHWVDEIALLVESEVEGRLLRRLLAEEGWVKFNEARDAVNTSPITSAYSVRYVFYQHVDFPWRLEVMKLEGGVSPLHTAIRPAAPPAPAQLVHASFKCSTEEGYAYARTGLEAVGLEEAQRCDSTYGRFSYWADLDAAHPPMDEVRYLKPRVNLRDMPEANR
jgi:hypothetical protein